MSVRRQKNYRQVIIDPKNNYCWCRIWDLRKKKVISHLRNKHKRYRDITANQDGDGNYEVAMIVECAFT